MSNNDTRKHTLIKGDALIVGGDKEYRIWLTREWDKSKPSIAFVMLNPHTADADTDDSTVQRCIELAKNWRYGELIVINLFDYQVADYRFNEARELHPGGRPLHALVPCVAGASMRPGNYTRGDVELDVAWNIPTNASMRPGNYTRGDGGLR